MCLHFKGINRASLNCKYASLFNVYVKGFILVCIRRRKKVLSDSRRQCLKMSLLQPGLSQLCCFSVQKVDLK